LFFWRSLHLMREPTTLPTFIAASSSRSSSGLRRVADTTSMRASWRGTSASTFGFGPRIYVPGGVNFDDYPDLEAMLTSLESVIMWMGNNPSMGPSWRDLKKPSARKFVMGVILVVEWYTGKAIQQDTKGTPAAELKVVKEIVAAVDPAITESTITGAIKDTSKSGLGARVGAGAGLGH